MLYIACKQPARGLDPDVFESIPLRLKVQLSKLSHEQRLRAVQWHADEAVSSTTTSSNSTTITSNAHKKTTKSSSGTTPPKTALRNSSGNHSDASPHSVHSTSTTDSTAAASSAHRTAEGGHTADNHTRHNGKHLDYS
jgi:hypothetical protein